MQITSVDLDTFHSSFPAATAGAVGMHLYNSRPFLESVRHRCLKLRCLLAGDTKVRCGIVCGVKEGDTVTGGRPLLASPFSAPFGGFVAAKEPSVEMLVEALEGIKEYAADHDCNLLVTLPSPIYGESFQAKCATALGVVGRLLYTDINYHYPLERIDDAEAFMSRSARKLLHQARSAGFVTTLLDERDPAAVARVYAVIEANRFAHGYPLRMSLDQVMATIPVAASKIAIMTLDGVDVAAALVHTVTPTIAQVIYWGDAPGYSDRRPMNIFTLELLRLLREMGFATADIGASSSKGVPAFGLCNFKESIGCLPTLRPTYLITTT